MKVFIAGGSGFVGTALTIRLLERGDEVTIVSSKGTSVLGENPALKSLQADTTKEGAWQESIADFDLIVNLTGRSVFHLWSESYKKQIYESRILTTRNIVQALPEKTNTTLLSASAVGYYGDSGELERDEDGEAGSDFLADVCRDWEREVLLAKGKGARVTIMRLGVILGHGGALKTMKTPFKLGLGGPIGTGRQYFPWIHIDDVVSAILFLTDNKELSGPFNFTSPGVVRQKVFARKLGNILRRPAFIPVPAFIMKTFFGEFGHLLLAGQKAVPEALTEAGFNFRYSALEDALTAILLE